MPKRSSRKRGDPPEDVNELAAYIVDRVTSEEETMETESEEIEARREAARILGRLGGKKGGPARAAKLTPEERREIAKRGAEARWAHHKKDSDTTP